LPSHLSDSGRFAGASMLWEGLFVFGLGLDVSMGAQFITQITGVVVTVVWCGLVSYVLLKLLDATVGLRVSEEEETEGLDLVAHAEKGYNF